MIYFLLTLNHMWFILKSLLTCEVISIDTPYCAQCIHYVPHYIKFGENLFDLIRCGHCTFPRKKHRDAYAKVCAHFQPLPK